MRFPSSLWESRDLRQRVAGGRTCATLFQRDSPCHVLRLSDSDPARSTTSPLKRADLLEAALAEDRLVLRTRLHPTVDAWPSLARAPSLDHLYEAGADFAQVYEAIAADVLARAAVLDRTGRPESELVYAVPGHPGVGEATVVRLRALAAERGAALRSVPGLSFVDTGSRPGGCGRGRGAAGS